MNKLNWAQAISHCQSRGQAYVIATVISTQGSTPRDGGSKMVVDAQQSYDTLGGGQLEYLIVQQARELIAQNQHCQLLKPFPLAAEAAQCCGGHVTVMLECIAAVPWQLALFGAGHVCQSLVTILAGLNCQVRIIDNRPELMQNQLPANCRYEFYADPVAAIEQLPDQTWTIVFTHNHALDFSLCAKLLRNYRWGFVGMIGSATKALRFRKRLADAGINEQLLAQLHSPIGLAQVKGKLPMEVAVSIAAQLLTLFAERQPAQAHSSSWREIKGLMSAANPSLAKLES